ARPFRHEAEGRGLAFEVQLDNGLGRSMITDSKRLQQVLKNLVSNAVKFTENGAVTLRFRRAVEGWSSDNEILSAAGAVVAFDVVDTGIGIEPEKQAIIFEAFRQADGTTSRKYGGTGLGLSISREIARLLGGEIRVTSEPGQGSTFTLFLPLTYVPVPEQKLRRARTGMLDTRPVRTDRDVPAAATGAPSPAAVPAPRPAAASGPAPPSVPPAAPPPAATPVPAAPANGSGTTTGPVAVPTKAASPTRSTAAENDTFPPSAALMSAEIKDDRAIINSGDKVLLMIEDDPNYYPLLIDLAHARGFKCVVSPRGDKGLKVARELRPTAITLDIRLPDMAGWLVLSRLKYDPATRHIPVHVISVDEDYRRGLALGAESYTEKVADLNVLERTFERIERSVRDTTHTLLLADSDPDRRRMLTETIGDQSGVVTTAVATGQEAIDVAATTEFDCAVLTPQLTDMRASELAEKLQKQAGRPELPMIVYAVGKLTPQEEAALREAGEHAVLKTVPSVDRLMEETAVFLNRREEDLTEEQKRIIAEARSKDAVLTGGKVLIIDDDVRNIFALTSGLERHKLTVLHAESGRKGLEMLHQHPDIDLVLMDIMMPEMDGYETTRRIRQVPEFRKLPVIALTAKAMRGDREKCIEAGASDYIPKPVVLEELVALLRVWLPQVQTHRMTEVQPAE
ncbi:MAG TPA: response regulator, partial [Bryobacteraceae bacterium]|nr:response regulator [Bryobacteraceae bacterium]